MTLPEKQLELDDLFIEFLERLGELVDFANERTQEQEVATEREFLWELIARVLLVGAK